MLQRQGVAMSHENDPPPAAGAQVWLSVVGIGEDGLEGLSPAARRAVEAAETLFGGRRHLALVGERPEQERITWPSPLEEARPWLLQRRGRSVCVLASGDPVWYGIGATLTRWLPAEEMRVYPAPSAFTLAAARMGWPLQDTRCLTLHGRALERILPWLQPGARLLALSWDETTPAALGRLLTDRGFGDARMTVLARMGGDHEQQEAATASRWADEPETVADLNTVAIECPPERTTAPIAATPGRPEDDFDHDGVITKREVRAVVLAHLAPGRGERLWDIGAGSGAVGIEWMLADTANRTIAVEPRPERAARIQTNARHFGVPELECITASAPGVLAELAAPDAVFIGGGLSTPGLLEACHSALPPGGRLVASGVTLEAESMLYAARGQYGGELIRLEVSRAEPLGGFTGWSPLRAVTLWVCTRT